MNVINEYVEIVNALNDVLKPISDGGWLMGSRIAELLVDRGYDHSQYSGAIIALNDAIFYRVSSKYSSVNTYSLFIKEGKRMNIDAINGWLEDRVQIDSGLLVPESFAKDAGLENSPVDLWYLQKNF